MKNEIEVFTSEEFGDIRTVLIDGEPWFVGRDVAAALGYTKLQNAIAIHVDTDDALKQGIEDSAGRRQKTTLINESGMYALILSSKLPSAKKFKRWVTSEVLPTIRRTGQFPPASIEEQIRLLAQGSNLANEKIEKLDKEVTALKTDMPLYGCEIDEVQKRVRKKGVEVLGGKESEAYHDGSIRSHVYSDIYGQLKREFGCVASYKGIKRKYLEKALAFIDNYIAPTALSEMIANANGQMRFA